MLANEQQKWFGGFVQAEAYLEKKTAEKFDRQKKQQKFLRVSNSYCVSRTTAQRTLSSCVYVV